MRSLPVILSTNVYVLSTASNIIEIEAISIRLNRLIVNTRIEKNQCIFQPHLYTSFALLLFLIRRVILFYDIDFILSYLISFEVIIKMQVIWKA